MLLLLWVVVLHAVRVADCAFAPTLVDYPVVCLQGGTMIDGHGGMQSNITIMISSAGLIYDFFPGGSKSIPPSCAIKDVSGMFVMPGLIDAHVHVSSIYPQNDTVMRSTLEFALRGGITTVRDMGGDVVFLSPYATQSMVPAFPSPRVYYSCLMGGQGFLTDPRVQLASHGFVPGSVPWLRLLDNTTDYDLAAREARGIKVTGLKIYGDVNRYNMLQQVQSGLQLGLQAWSHAAVFPARPSDAVYAGVQVMSHSAYLVWEAVSPMPTSYTARFSANYSAYAFNSKNITNLLLRMAGASVMLDATVWIFNQTESDPVAIDWIFNVTALAHTLGVSICAGTDDIGEPASGGFPNLHSELELLVTRCGMTPMEALVAGTRRGAEALNIADSYGSIVRGKVADLVVLYADPTKNIRNTRAIEYVIKEGVFFSPNT